MSAINTLNKLSDADYRFCERLLYDYRSQESAIAQLELELAQHLANMEPGPRGATLGGEPKGWQDDTGDCTEPERWAIMSEENTRSRWLREELARRKRHQRLIADALEAMTADESEFCRLFYGKSLSVRQVADRMHYSKSKVYIIRQSAVHVVGKYAGLI